MSKIYEALQQAHQQKKTSGKNLEVDHARNLLDQEEVDIGEEMLSLHKVIDTLLPGRKEPCHPVHRVPREGKVRQLS